MRQYDPATGRWVVQDPVVHHDMSPYNAFDNNPVFWADPSGADSQSGSTDAFGRNRFDASGIYVPAFERFSYASPFDNAEEDRRGSSDNDCPSCKTKADWDTYYKQAENMIAMIGDDRISTSVDEKGNTVYYLDGKPLDLIVYNNRAEALGQLLGAAALIEAPIQGLKILGSIFKSGAPKTGTTVLGHYPEYVKVAETIGAKTFQIPTKVWNKMSPSGQWAANQKFLDRMISRGDNIRLATPLNKVKPGSFYQKELNYLFDRGYKVSSNGLWLTK